MRSALSNHMCTEEKKKIENKERQEVRNTHFDILIFGKTIAFDLRKINFIASTTTVTKPVKLQISFSSIFNS